MADNLAVKLNPIAAFSSQPAAVEDAPASRAQPAPARGVIAERDARWGRFGVNRAPQGAGLGALEAPRSGGAMGAGVAKTARVRTLEAKRAEIDRDMARLQMEIDARGAIADGVRADPNVSREACDVFVHAICGELQLLQAELSSLSAERAALEAELAKLR